MEKPLEDFTPHKRGKYGRISYCRPCNATYVRKQNANPETRAKNAFRVRNRRRDPAKAAADRATSKAWKLRNPEQVKATNAAPSKVASNKAWRERNRDKDIEATRRYQAKHPEIGALSQQWRRARKMAAGSSLTAAQWRAILAEFNHCCAYCLRADAPLQQEHLIPLSKGGAHAVGNVIPSCGPCNYRKHTRHLLQFLMIGATA